MKKRNYIVTGLILVMVFLGALSGCDMLAGLLGGGTTVSASARVNLFIDDVEDGDLYNLKRHFSEEGTQEYDQMTEETWTNTPFDFDGVTITPGTSSTSGDTVTIPAVLDGADTYDIVFTLEPDADGNYFIKTLTFEDSTYSAYDIRKLGLPE